MVSVLRFGTIAPHQGLTQRFAFWETEAIHMVVAPGLNLSLRFKGWARGDAAFEWISNGVAIGREVMPKAPNGRVSIHVDSGIPLSLIRITICRRWRSCTRYPPTNINPALRCVNHLNT
jgi:hypothetical protein